MTPEIIDLTTDDDDVARARPYLELIPSPAARADDVLAAVAPVLEEGDVVLVGHGHFSRVLIARWIGLPAAAGVNFAMDAASWAVLGHERGVPRCDHVNLSDLT